MTLGSLFDGSGTMPLSAVISGIEPVWASEIEPYPIAVTKFHFPNMKHYLDIHSIKGSEVEPVDIIAGGSPCQNLSVAGNHHGLDGEQSHLFYEMVRIIKEMRETTNGKYPRYFVWENVKGAFSSGTPKGEDFRRVLESFCRLADDTASVPLPKEGWKPAGEIVGDGWSIAWRLMDAQYWGVPQRRKRIYLVGCLDSERAAEVLFERQSVSGDYEQSGKERKSASSDAKGSVGGSDCAGFLWKNSATAGSVGYEIQLSPTAKADGGGNRSGV